MILAGFVVDVFATRGRAAMNVELGDVDVSRHDTNELGRDMAALEARLAKKALGVGVDRTKFELDPKAIGFRLDRDATQRAVLGGGRSGGLVGNFFGFIGRIFAPIRVAPAVRLDEALLRQKVAEWQAKAISDAPFSGDLELQGTTFVARPPRGGRTLNESDVRRLVAGALADPAQREITLPISKVAPAPREPLDRLVRDANALVQRPVVLSTEADGPTLSVGPEVLAKALRVRGDGGAPSLGFDVEALRVALEPERGKFEREPVDAKFEVDHKEQLSITPSQVGLRIDFARLPAVLLDAARSGATAPLPLLNEPLPALSTEQAQALGIKGLVSSFTTRHACCERRVENIHRIADLLNGLVVRPGETVSLNAVVGPRTAKNGFVPAPTIEEGEMVDTYGGGISQFATTIFNALFHGGYDIVERQPHTYWFPRYPMGHEATLSWPKPDLVFRNDTEAGLLIKTVYTDKSITVKLYGDNGGRKVTAEVSPQTNFTQPQLTLVPNPALEPNREKVKDSGALGWSVMVSRVLTFPDGTKREEKRKVTYKPRPRHVEVHPCRIPKGEKGYTGERCPEPKDAEIVAGE